MELNFERRCFSPAPFGEKLVFSGTVTPVSSGFSAVFGRAVERGGKGWRTADADHLCSHSSILLGSERPTRKAYPRQRLLAQCREFVDSANAMDRSVVYVMQHLDGCMSGSSRDRFRPTPSTSDAETRPRPTTCAKLSRHAKLSRCCCCRRRTCFEVNRTRGAPGCDCCASLKWASKKVGFVKKFVRLQAEA